MLAAGGLWERMARVTTDVELWRDAVNLCTDWASGEWNAYADNSCYYRRDEFKNVSEQPPYRTIVSRRVANYDRAQVRHVCEYIS